MGLTGNWDGRLSRRTLLRTGGSAAAGVAADGPRDGGARRVALRQQAVRAGRRIGRPDARRRRAVDAARARSARRRRRHAPVPELGVRYEVAADEDFRRIVRRGVAGARPREAHTVHVELTGLQPGNDVLVPLQVGHDDQPDRSHPHRAAARLDGSDAVRVRVVPELHERVLRRLRRPCHARRRPRRASRRLHLRGTRTRRRLACATTSPRPSCSRSNDYRLRHAQYRTDPDLQAAHAAHPFLMTWDDHEFKDNYADLDLDPNEPLETVAPGAPPPTSPTGSTRRWRARASRSARTCRCSGACSGAASRRSTCSTRASTARTSSGRSARRRSATPFRATAPACSTRRAGSSAPRSAIGCSPASPRRPRRGT